VADLTDVLCPPYDVISADERARLAALNPRNAVHVELPESYAAAADIFTSWRSDGTLVRDDRLLLYIYEQRYQTSDGGEAASRGFFCRLRLEPYGPDGGVLPHEKTLSAAKEDRYHLMKAVRANLSPVLFLYDDTERGQAAAQLIEDVTAGEPQVDAVGPGGLPNRMWLADPSESTAARSLLDAGAARPVVIADGHHRYETALRYCAEAGADVGANSVLALMYEAHSGGLALRPWHRVLRGIGDSVPLALEQWLELKATSTPGQLLRDLASSTIDKPGVFGVWTASGGGLLEPGRGIAAEVPSPVGSESVRRLDVSVLSATLSRMCGTTPENLAAAGKLAYYDDALKALAEVQSGRADAAFLVRPTPVEDVLAVAAAGDYMPAKSTLFYPKAATGLVFNPLGE
jgi:uncharacterized protein (DUF1015 family)